MRILKKSTATTVLLGPFVDETDGKTAETGLTIAQADVLLWKEGGTTMAQKSETTSCTHRSNGYYTCPLDTTDTGTNGILHVTVHKSGALPVKETFYVVHANTFDGMISYSGLGSLANVVSWNTSAVATPTVAGVPEVDITHFNGTAGTFASGRPEVNTSHIAGSAVSTSSAQIGVNVVNFGGAAGTFASGIPQASLTTSAINSIADQVLDESITDHRAANSLGAMLQPLHSGTCPTIGSPLTTTIKLAAGASSADDFYNGDLVVAWSADGATKVADYITDYVGATQTATVTGFASAPQTGWTYAVMPGGTIPGASAPSANDNAAAVWNALWASYTASGSFGERFGAIRRNTFASVASSSAMTLDAGASTSVNHYKYATLRLLSGTYAGESRQIIDHTAGRVVTVSPAFTGAPAGGDAYIIEPLGIDAATVETIVDGIWDEPRAGHGTAGTYGEYVYADLTRLNGDAGAAANAEAFFDGTGYAGTNNVIPTVTSVTNAVSANVTAISGDGPAADNLEAMLDGTGGVNLTAAFIGNITGNLSGSVGSVTGAVGSVTGAVGSVTGAVGSVTGGVTVTTNNDKTGYRLSATGVDDIWDEPITEPSSVFAWASATPRNIVGFLGQMNRNKQTLNKTTGAFVLRNNADGADVGTATHTDDGTTTTRGKVS